MRQRLLDRVAEQRAEHLAAQSGAGALAVAYNMSSESLHSRSVEAIRAAAAARWGDTQARRKGALASRHEADVAREEHAAFLASSHQRVASVRERKERQVRACATAGAGRWGSPARTRPSRRQMTWIFIVALSKAALRFERSLQVDRLLRLQSFIAVNATILIQVRRHLGEGGSWHRSLLTRVVVVHTVALPLLFDPALAAQDGCHAAGDAQAALPLALAPGHRTQAPRCPGDLPLHLGCRLPERPRRCACA